MYGAIVLGCERPYHVRGQLCWRLRNALGVEVFLSYVKKVTRAGTPIYGISIPLERATARPDSFPEYKALCAVAKRYDLSPPAIHVCISAENDIYYDDEPVVGQDDYTCEHQDPQCKKCDDWLLAAGLEHLRVSSDRE